MIEKVCTFEQNPIIQSMRDRGERFPTSTPKDLHSLEESDLERIQEAAKKMEGWTGSVARFLVYFYPYTGLRPSELRLARIDDLNTRDWTFYVAFPKGAGRYAKKRTVLIAPPARRATLEYLSERDEYLKRRGYPDAKPLIPSIYKGKAKTYSATRFRILKKRLSEESGVDFKLKDYRPSFAQLTIDMNPNLLPDVSKQLGHASTRTTEEYYARIRDRDAFKRLEEAWGGFETNVPRETISNLMR
jgi:integrase